MKSLVVFYSRTGNTQKVGESLAKLLNAETEEIIDTTNRKGAVAWFIAGMHGFKKNLTKMNLTALKGGVSC